MVVCPGEKGLVPEEAKCRERVLYSEEEPAPAVEAKSRKKEEHHAPLVEGKSRRKEEEPAPVVEAKSRTVVLCPSPAVEAKNHSMVLCPGEEEPAPVEAKGQIRMLCPDKEKEPAFEEEAKYQTMMLCPGEEEEEPAPVVEAKSRRKEEEEEAAPLVEAQIHTRALHPSEVSGTWYVRPPLCSSRFYRSASSSVVVAVILVGSPYPPGVEAPRRGDGGVVEASRWWSSWWNPTTGAQSVQSAGLQSHLLTTQ